MQKSKQRFHYSWHLVRRQWRYISDPSQACAFSCLCLSSLCRSLPCRPQLLFNKTMNSSRLLCWPALPSIRWVSTHQAHLHGRQFVSSPNLAMLIGLHPLIKLELSTLQAPGVTKTSSNVDDILIASQVLQGEVAGVIFFHDATGQGSETLAILERACDVAEVPLALNTATANIALRGLAKTRQAYLIFNPVAGQGQPEQELATIRSILEPQLVLTVVYTQIDREAADQATEIVNMIKASAAYATGDKSSTMIIASGGDGTVSAVAGATMGSGIPFGVIPRGTANAFSVALGIPTTLEASCRNLLAGNVRVLDGAMCNDKIPMILLAGLGFEAGMVDAASRELKNMIGTLAYVLGGAQQMITQQPFTCKVTIDDKEYDNLNTSAVTIANVAPPTSVLAQGFGSVTPDDGLLDVTIATAVEALQGLEAMASLLTAAVVKLPTQTDTLLCVRAKEVSIQCNEPQKLVIDGEMFTFDEMRFSVVPDGLSVIVPPKE